MSLSSTQRQVAIVEHDPFLVETRGNDGVIFAAGKIADDNEPHVVFGETCFAQCHVFGDGVILAIAAAAGERRQRRAPAVGHAPLGDDRSSA